MNTQHRALTSIAISAVAMSSLVAQPASAAEGPVATTYSVSVEYVPAVLNSDEGAQAVYERLRNAAERACGQYEFRDLAARQQWKACYAEALSTAVERLDDERVAALHHGRRRSAQG